MSFSVFELLLIRAMLVLFCSLPVAAFQELNVVDDVHRLSHHHHTQPKVELTLSLQSKLDSVEKRLRNLDTRSVHSPSYLNTRVT